MDLVSIKDVRHPRSESDIPPWRPGYGWLAGGTWLFSEPQWALDTLVDLEGLGWPALQILPEGLEIAATCPILQVDRFVAPAAWTAAPLFALCCQSLLASFKVKYSATVGGNICMSLPAGAMSSLAVALEATYTLWPREGEPRTVPSAGFITGNHANILAPGELLRSIHIPITALTKRFAFRQMSLTHLGRSAALIIGTRGVDEAGFLLTITAATPTPVQIHFAQMPTADDLRQAILDSIDDAHGYFTDPHGRADYKRHLTRAFAEQIRLELSAEAGAAA
jgi:CO/xanthine dehydrogenase FAD-binding subunit